MSGVRGFTFTSLLVLAVEGNLLVVHASPASFTGLGDFVGGRFESAAFGISPDGNVVTGYGYNQYGNQEAFR